MLIVGLLCLGKASLLYYGAVEGWGDVFASIVMGIIVIALIVIGFVLAILPSKKDRKPKPHDEPGEG